AENPAFPFCSSRCKWVDLSKWISGEYYIAVGSEESERDAPVAGLHGSDPRQGPASASEEVN
ncbi:MAG: DNA gyrase inhibitor YacG, partial [Myxococcota bacterium]|nr:DNA gyrase inhibitor YacG [Myxococcota bacterium]